MEKAFYVGQQHLERSKRGEWEQVFEDSFRFICMDERNNVDLFPSTDSSLRYMAHLINRAYEGNFLRLRGMEPVEDNSGLVRVVTKPLEGFYATDLGNYVYRFK